LQPVFNGGRNRANLAYARQSYDESVANYREAVLEAFQQVEDGLAGLTSSRAPLPPRMPPSLTPAARWKLPTIATSAA